MAALRTLRFPSCLAFCRKHVNSITGRSFAKCQARFLSSVTERDGLQVSHNSNTGVVTLSMNKPPVNSLNLEFLQSMHKTLGEIQDDQDCRAVILTSGLTNIFCAGLDITEMYQPDDKRLREFWTSLQDMWIRLYSFPKTTMAAITGHSPAGGALLAMSCDYRVMAENFTIGLNETKLGIVAPTWFIDLYVGILGQRLSELALQTGKLFTSEEALKVGLVDQVVPLNDVIPTVEKELSEWKIPALARGMTKDVLRRIYWRKLQETQDVDTESFVFLIKQEKVQQTLGLYLQSLKNKKK
ncbi:enoyl-CoA delta isomerase 1, mitochondrial isoform X2 [Lingula anatina]|nr:enoyl-CoA delta isomerase 1, mitochondrial isoform X2 [Lingula anatina]XP_013408534.1 enoyl-CoA delta isomerase 1, mitochondrial isoform X2 [Lingula anatina]XP_013408535.1 enoyl-CoA delta isomerase 1, mitochondrial isoform X2 [Lingula anatina]|eukprot:XP_013408533.1 enoyl-CoA delta isomerase 1, mitochondrial isoform X2 [Lingula anatina]